VADYIVKAIPFTCWVHKSILLLKKCMKKPFNKSILSTEGERQWWEMRALTEGKAEDREAKERQRWRDIGEKNRNSYIWKDK
jgi:hypothetical protein